MNTDERRWKEERAARGMAYAAIAVMLLLAAALLAFGQQPASPSTVARDGEPRPNHSVELQASETQVLALLRRDSVAADEGVVRAREAHENAVRQSVLKNQAFWGEVQRLAQARGLDGAQWGFDAANLRFIKKQPPQARKEEPKP